MAGAAELVESIWLAHPAELVWRALSDPAWLAGWLVDRVEGELAPGRRIAFHYDSVGLALELEVVACEAPRRLVLRGLPPGRPPQLQTIDLVDRSGGTEVVLRHQGFRPGAGGADERAGSQAGWYTQLRVLDHYLATHPGSPRIQVAALAPAASSLALAWPLLATPSGLARWLAEQPIELGGEGEPFRLITRTGLALGGSVLAVAPPYQLALALDELAGALVLRAIQIDISGALLLGAQAWSWTPPGFPRTQAQQFRRNLTTGGAPAAAWGDLADELNDAVARLVDAAGGPRGGAA